jgi:MoaA/NifB/PqqE/SkfB family radical SAM enzyme
MRFRLQSRVNIRKMQIVGRVLINEEMGERMMETSHDMDHLTKLYVEITTACNLDCQMCVRRAWREPIGSMSLETFGALIAQLRRLPSLPVVHLGGYGEPMWHPDFLEMVRLAKAAGAQVGVTTNGTLLDADTAAALIELGLDRLVVSIDGVTPESYGDIRRNGSLEQVVENLRTLYRLKLRRAGKHSNPQVGIAFVAMKRNAADLPQLPRLATRIGAWTIQVSNLIPHTPEMESEILYNRSLTACAFRASRWVADMSLPKLDLDSHTLEPLGRLSTSTASLSLLDASLSARNDYCRFAQQGYAAVRWDGQVSPCLSLLHDHPMYLHGRRKDVTHFALGNVNDRSLPDLWESRKFAQFRAKLRRFPFSPCTTCGGCERFPRNRIDCSDNTFPTCGGCLWAQGFVQCP